jgi:hypothetical protein
MTKPAVYLRALSFIISKTIYPLLGSSSLKN